MTQTYDPLSPERRERLRPLLSELTDGLVERDTHVRLAVLAALAGEHVLLLGPPGTAKSLIARRLCGVFGGRRLFQRLLTRFTVPEELFGPLSLRALEEDRFERRTEGYLPDASIAFLDEVFKANSAILNALLSLLNERTFDNGTDCDRTPLLTVVGASNELPEGGELDALRDRFLVRLFVGPVTEDGFGKLLEGGGAGPMELSRERTIRPSDIEAIGEAARDVAIGEDARAIIETLRAFCRAQEITVSDRRWLKLLKLLRVAAWTDGRSEVSVWDLWLAPHCLWNRPEELATLREWYEARVGATADFDPQSLTTFVVAWEAHLERDQEPRQMRDAEGRLLYDGPEGPSPSPSIPLSRDGEPLFVAPEDPGASRDNHGHGYTQSELQKHRGFRRLSNREAYLSDPKNRLTKDAPPLFVAPTPEYLADCLRQVTEHDVRAAQYLESLDAHVRTVEETLDGHLWVEQELSQVAIRQLVQRRREVQGLRERLARVAAAYEEIMRPLAEAAE